MSNGDAFVAGFRTAELRAITKLREAAEYWEGKGAFLLAGEFRMAADFLETNRYKFEEEE